MGKLGLPRQASPIRPRHWPVLLPRRGAESSLDAPLIRYRAYLAVTKLRTSQAGVQLLCPWGPGPSTSSVRLQIGHHDTLHRLLGRGLETCLYTGPRQPHHCDDAPTKHRLCFSYGTPRCLPLLIHLTTDNSVTVVVIRAPSLSATHDPFWPDVPDAAHSRPDPCCVRGPERLIKVHGHKMER
ncbi:hypothetical protein HDV63DRAFT_376712 [Trichoderma sp. SZMC 28014]